ncbi:MAG TPA: S9 family peptidase [Chitinophagaceae bacterium]|nr:S9 family peptidase [Chitinophagaceae bacterium]
MKKIIPLLTSTLLILSCNNITTVNKETYKWPEGVATPVAEKKPVKLEAHSDIRVDDYYWMNDFFKKGPDSNRVVDYLNAENAYVETMMAGTKTFQENLFKELKGRIKEKDESVPYHFNGFWYYNRYEEGKQYPVYCRKKGSLEAPEEIMHDGNAAAEGKKYYNAAGLRVSDNNELLAIGEDDVSRRLYKLRFKNLVTGQFSPETILNTEGGSYAWAADNKTVFYIRKDLTTLLGFQVWRHVVGTDPATDVKVYEEKDNRHYIGVSRSKSQKYIFIESELSNQQSEIRFLDASNPAGEFTVFQPRTMGLVYDIDHFSNKFYIRTNLDALNFRLMECPLDKTNRENWKEVIPHRADVYLSGITIFKEHLVVSELKEGLTGLRIIDQKDKTEHYLEFDEPAYLASVGTNPDFNTNKLRFNYTSMITPASVYDYDMDIKTKELKKQSEVVGGYDKNEYITERAFVPSRDGKRIPVSLVYKKGMKKDGSHPALLYAYGSYGSTSYATFSSNRLSLSDRGFVYVLAHIRGGQEMGRQWYDDGKMFNKINTFNDFIDCGEFLFKEKYTSKGHLYAQGGSAGGLLMGAVANMAPDLWNGIIAAVPFVDVITTMSDASIPLTTGEYLEWGNPAIREEYFYMKSYSPYDNVVAKAYPNMLVTTGLHDSQVQYFEPAKWVAKLRELKTDKNIILFKTNMDAGHGGASGRFDYLKDIALQYAFLFTLEGISK